MMRKHDIEFRELDGFDDLVIALISIKNLEDGYIALGLEVPDWLSAKVKEGKHELTARIRIRKERQLQTLKLRREGLLTSEEKRSKVDVEIAELEKELA